MALGLAKCGQCFDYLRLRSSALLPTRTLVEILHVSRPKLARLEHVCHLVFPPIQTEKWHPDEGSAWQTHVAWLWLGCLTWALQCPRTHTPEARQMLGTRSQKEIWTLPCHNAILLHQKIRCLAMSGVTPDLQVSCGWPVLQVKLGSWPVSSVDSTVWLCAWWPVSVLGVPFLWLWVPILPMNHWGHNNCKLQLAVLLVIPSLATVEGRRSSHQSRPSLVGSIEHEAGPACQGIRMQTDVRGTWWLATGVLCRSRKRHHPVKQTRNGY